MLCFVLGKKDASKPKSLDGANSINRWKVTKRKALEWPVPAAGMVEQQLSASAPTSNRRQSRPDGKQRKKTITNNEKATGILGCVHTLSNTF